MKGYKFFVTGVAILFLCMALPAYAGIQNWNITGTVTYFNQNCGTGLTGIGDTWSGLVSFDDSRILSVLPYKRNPISDDLALEINIPGWSPLYEYNDGDYNKTTVGSTPNFYFTSDGKPGKLDFEAEYNNNWVLTIAGTNQKPLEWKISQYNGTTKLIAGTYQFNSVPIPGAVWLLGSGLVALVGLRKRTRKAP